RAIFLREGRWSKPAASTLFRSRENRAPPTRGIQMFRTFAVFVISVGGMAQSLAQEALRFDIPSQDLASSLNQLAVSADWQIVFAPELLKDRKALALAGSYTPDEALKKLLQPTGLRADYLDSKTVAIRLAKEGENLTKLISSSGNSLRLASASD